MSYRSELLSTSATQQVSVSRRPHSPGEGADGVKGRVFVERPGVGVVG